ncbi:MAG: DUF1295 domain-containing protein [Chloroflexi bacterium]|nr:DUF1295 domain-containing protein [Chloroflexota bacterium]
MPVCEVYLVGLAAALGLLTTLWLVSLALRNSSIVDIFWGAGFVVLGWFYFLLAPQGLPARKLLIAVLVTVWGLRLSLYILSRNRGKGEDFRYVAMRQAAGASWWWQSYLKVFVLQGVLMWLISTPLLAAQFGATPGLTILDGLGLLVWAIGFFFEAAGDWQLARFKADPANKGQVMNRGVWRYTRHPNYFGDAAQWWGFFLIALAAGGWMTIFSPILMTFLLVRVSGKALLEKNMVQRPGYREYIESTRGFVPWLPRKTKGKGS